MIVAPPNSRRVIMGHDMKHNLFCSAGLGAALLLAATTAQAGTYRLDYTLIGSATTGDLLVTTTDTPTGGPFTVTSITGERGGDTVTALSPYAGSDQLLYATDPRFDLSGVSFSTAGSGDFNLYSYNNQYFELSSNVDPVGYPQNGSPISLTVSEVPEPASIGLFGVAVLGLGALLYGRRTGGGLCA